MAGLWEYYWSVLICRVPNNIRVNEMPKYKLFFLKVGIFIDVSARVTMSLNLFLAMGNN